MKQKIILLLVAAFLGCQLFAQSKEQNQSFFNEQIQKLELIKPLLPKEKKKLSTSFWNELNTNESDNKNAFNIAMSKTLSDSTYFKEYFKDDLSKRALLIFQDDYNYYKQNMKLSTKSLLKIKPVLQRRSEEYAYCEIRYLALPNERFKEKEKIKAKYRTNIMDTSMKEDSKGATYNLRLVLENRDKLKLSKNQIDSIVAGAQQIKTLEKQGIITQEKGNRWEYERKIIINALNEEQVNQFVVIRSAAYSLTNAQKAWKEMKELNISFEYDSVRVVREIYNYNISKEKIKYIYKDEPDKLKELDDYLYKAAYPKALKHLRVEKRKNNNQESNDKNTLTF